MEKISESKIGGKSSNPCGVSYIHIRTNTIAKCMKRTLIHPNYRLISGTDICKSLLFPKILIILKYFQGLTNLQNVLNP